MEKCMVCQKADSIMVEGEGYPPLCRACAERAGDISVGDRVVCKVDAGLLGLVREMDDSLAIVDVAGNEAHIPICELVPLGPPTDDERLGLVKQALQLVGAAAVGVGKEDRRGMLLDSIARRLRVVVSLAEGN